jgi:hypothetical protein
VRPHDFRTAVLNVIEQATWGMEPGEPRPPEGVIVVTLSAGFGLLTPVPVRCQRYSINLLFVWM